MAYQQNKRIGHEYYLPNQGEIDSRQWLHSAFPLEYPLLLVYLEQVLNAIAIILRHGGTITIFGR